MESKQVEAIAAFESEVKAAVDPLPPGTLGMYLFLASEAMFFVGLLGAYIVLMSAGEQHQLFVKSSKMLVKSGACWGTGVLVCSSICVTQRARWVIGVALGAAVYFLLLQIGQWSNLLNHDTIVLRETTGPVVYDGLYVNAIRSALQSGVDLHTITSSDIRDKALPAASYQLGTHWRQKLNGQVIESLNYGPSRNNFFASYFLITGAHVLHLLVGMIAVLWFMIFRPGKLPDSLQIYWHFVNAVGVVTLIALYFL